MDFKFEFWFDIYSYHTEWASKLMEFIGKILKRLDGNCLLESNGDTPILLRWEGKIIVNDKNLAGTERFPFSYLDIKYEEGDLGSL